jgi:polysaccharide pyruvyl transferase WcaK-like protein
MSGTDQGSAALAGCDAIAEEGTPPVKLCLLGAGFATGNRGVAALASGTIAAAFHCFGKGTVLLDYARRSSPCKVFVEGGEVEIPLANLRFSKNVCLPNSIFRLVVSGLLLRLFPFRGLRSWMLGRNEYLKLLDQMPVAASLAGGDSFSDIYGLGRLVYVALPQILILLLRKPLILLPQTYGPFQRRSARLIARWILRRAAHIYSRDAAGVETVTRLLNRQRPAATFAYDMAFALPPRAPKREAADFVEQLRSQGTLVGLNVSGLLYAGGYTRNNMFGLASDYPKTIQQLLAALLQKSGGQVLLIPHVFGRQMESDVSACRAVMGQLEPSLARRVHLLEEEFDQHELKYMIGRCEFFVGSRMHACIAAVSQAVPGISLAYSKKFSGVMDSILPDALVADLRTLDTAHVVEAVIQHYEDRQRLRAALTQKMLEVREDTMNFFRRTELKFLFQAA